MRKLLILSLAAAALAAACSKDSTSPADPSADASAEAGLFGVGGPGAMGGPGFMGAGFLRALPPELKLTSDQQAKVQALVKAFQQANKAELDALASIMEQARDAREAGKSRDEVRQILEQARPIRERLASAGQQLRSDIEAVLTQAQKDWLASHGPQRCDVSKAPPLSDAQKSQIQALRQAFEQANKADLDVIRTAFRQAAEARRAGKSPEEVSQILQAVKPAIERLRAARQKLATDLQSILTPDQRASGCYRFFGPMGAGRRNG